jgi:hypothetical protein
LAKLTLELIQLVAQCYPDDEIILTGNDHAPLSIKASVALDFENPAILATLF